MERTAERTQAVGGGERPPLTMEQSAVIRDYQRRGYRLDVRMHGHDDVRVDEQGHLHMNYHVSLRDPAGVVVARRDGEEIWATTWACIADVLAAQD